MTSHRKPVGIALSGEHLAVLLADRALTARLNDSGLTFAVAGIDRVDRAVPRPGGGQPGDTVDPFLAADTLAAWAPRLGWLTAAAVHQDDPYRLARRVASASQRSGGRSGLVLGLRERSALAGYDGRELWSWDGLTAGLPASPATTRDTAAAIRSLWQGWPSPMSPVLAWRAESTGEAAAARRVADVLIWPAGRPADLAAVAAASSGGPRLFLEMPAGSRELGQRLARHLADDRVAGLILRPQASETALREFTGQLLPVLAGPAALRTQWPGPLRERLRLPVPQPGRHEQRHQAARADRADRADRAAAAAAQGGLSGRVAAGQSTAPVRTPLFSR